MPEPLDASLLPAFSALAGAFAALAGAALWRRRADSGVPAARVIEGLSDPALVLEDGERVVDFNRAAARIFPLEGVAGANVELLVGAAPRLRELLGGCGRRDAEIRLTVDGQERHFEASVCPVGSPLASTPCEALILRDATQLHATRVQLERESSYVRVLHEVGLEAARAGTLEAAMQGSLECMCRALGFAVGHAYLPDPQQESRIAPTRAAHASDERFRPLLREMEAGPALAADEWLAGQVFAQRRPLCLADFSGDANDARACQALRYGLRGALAFPITLRGEVLAVVELLSENRVHSEPSLDTVLEHVGELLAQVMERKRADARIRELAYYDDLTGLPNRALFSRRLERALQDAREKDHNAAILFIDLDQFKTINDTLGHAAGDELLREVSSRFQRATRITDVVSRKESTDTVSRLGGDEFTVLLPEVRSPEDAARVARRLVESLGDPIRLDNQEIFARCSVGIAVYPLDGSDAATLFRNADAAMYAAKQDRAGSLAFYSGALNEASERQLRLENRLRRAIERDDFELNYQPIRCLESGEVSGAEALLRWTDEELGSVSPAEFVPVAERTGLIGEIGAWVLRRACESLREWCLEKENVRRLSVNVSAMQIRTTGWFYEVSTTLQETGFPAHCLDLEITESAVLGDQVETLDVLQRVRELGVSFSLDDFGTGYSALSHLRILPVDRVKMDRMFVKELPDSKEDAALAGALIEMVHVLGKRIVAEGVETEEQARFLGGLGADELQGYLLAKPLDRETFLDFTKS